MTWGDRLSRRHVVILAAACGVALLAAAGYLVGPPSPAASSPDDQTTSTGDLGQASLAGSQAAEERLLRDTDRDGLPDVRENFVYGSDPDDPTTVDGGVPDGWLAQYGFDPTEPGVELSPAATPDPQNLPLTYGGRWPDRFDWTLKDAYVFDKPTDWNVSRDGMWDNGIEPRRVSYADDGIPYAWLVHYGLTPLTEKVEDRDMDGDGLAVHQEYRHQTDPTAADSDGDGLTDDQEINRYGTNPRAFSTGGTGIADGWLARHGLDPSDPRIGSRTPTGKGMSVEATWTYNVQRFGLDRTLLGRGLDPLAVNTRDLGVPDGWLVGHGLDPLDPDVADRVLQRASNFTDVRHLATAPGDRQPLPDLVLTVRDAYTYRRPAGWSETSDGVWRGGLDPSRPDEDGDGLPSAVELRGWYATRFLDTGPDPEPVVYRASSDPLLADTDGDGLTDGEEYHGNAVRNGTLHLFNASDPKNPDTAFSGIADGAKVHGLGLSGDSVAAPADLPDDNVTDVVRTRLDPTRRDSDADHLVDGDEIEVWQRAASHVGSDYRDLYPGSHHTNHLEWITELGAFKAQSLSKDAVARLLGPEGDADGDGKPNIADDDADDDGLLDGWEADPATLKFSDFSTRLARSPTDPANPDTDADGLPDRWEIEHGRAIDNRWDLNPARWSSDGDDTGDGDENLDEDVVTWYTFDGHDRTPHAFPYNNLRELNFGTDPHVQDENGDGVTEGWMVFWGTVYPSVSDKGDVRPDQIAITQTQDRFRDPLNRGGDEIKRAGAGQGEVLYRRVEEVPEGTNEDEVLNEDRDETYLEIPERDNPRPYPVLGRDEERRLGIIEGTYRHRFAEDQVHGLNPYLGDTDGDGLPDAWEAYYRCEGGDGVDPADPDASDDADADGLTNLQEFKGPKTDPSLTPTLDPCRGDTDLGGRLDGEEAEIANNDPLDPVDDAQGESGVDSDGDGVDDDEEITQGTNPADPDTDNDGLLDGDNTDPLDLTDSDDKSKIERFRTLGIAHELLEDNRIDFLDERTTDPTDPHSIVDGVPDGWMAYYNRFNAEDADKRRQEYRCGRPDWWAEEAHGVWWWGVSPNGACHEDLDFDGLNDRNGEDPVPGASPFNASADPRDAADDPDVGSTELRNISQTWGNWSRTCAGDPSTCKTAWVSDGPGNRVPSRFEDLAIDLPNDVVWKGDPFNVVGRLVAKCDPGPGCPAPNRTVLVQLDSPHAARRTLGVGFTDDQGDFDVEACVCTTHSASIPQLGTVARGRDRGTVQWTVPAGDLSVERDHSLHVRTYNTTTTFWGGDPPDADHPQHVDVTFDGETYHATRANVSHVADVSINSTTELDVTAPGQIPWTDGGRTLPVIVELTDAVGGPVDDASVTVELEDHPIQATVTTNDKGRATAPLTLPDTLVGTVRVTAAFAETPHYDGSTASPAEVVLQRPLNLTMRAGSGDGVVRSDTNVPVEVEATSFGSPVEGLDVTLTLGTRERTATTDPSGRAEFTLSTEGMVASTRTLQVRIEPTTARAGATAGTTLEIVSGARLDAVLPGQVGVGQNLTVNGRLTLPDGTPLGNQDVDVRIDGAHVANLTTTAAGTFQEDVTVPQSVGAGLHTVGVAFGGIPGQVDAVAVEDTVRVAVPIALSVDDVTADRNQTVTLSGRLRSGGSPLPGEFVSVHIDDLAVETLTDDAGRFATTYTVPRNASFGVHPVHVAYSGSRNGTYAASTGAAALTVTSESRLRLDPVTSWRRGNNTVTGRLTAPNATPIPNAPVDVTVNDRSLSQVTTDADGRFQLDTVLGPDVRPGPVPVRARYPGNATYGPARANVSAPLTVTPQLRLNLPDDVGRGADLTIRAALIDDVDIAVTRANVTVQAFDQEIVLDLDAEGQGRGQIPVPADADLGPASVRVAFEGRPGLRTVAVEHTVTVKEAVQLSVEGLPETIAPGAPVPVTVQLRDGHGNPVSDAKVGLRFEGASPPVIVETDADGTVRTSLTAPPDDAPLVARYAGNDVYAETTEASRSIQVKSSGASVDDGSVLVPAVLSVAAVALIGVAVGTWRQSPEPEPALGPFVEAERRIQQGAPWQEVIQDTYRQLSNYLASLGFEERPTESPREFVQALHRAAPIPEDAAVAFVHLYEEASYADAQPDPEQADQAKQELQRIVAAIEEQIHRDEDVPPTEEGG